jgi:hypothetical protein
MLQCIMLHVLYHVNLLVSNKYESLCLYFIFVSVIFKKDSYIYINVSSVSCFRCSPCLCRILVFCVLRVPMSGDLASRISTHVNELVRVLVWLEVRV